MNDYKEQLRLAREFYKRVNNSKGEARFQNAIDAVAFAQGTTATAELTRSAITPFRVASYEGYEELRYALSEAYNIRQAARQVLSTFLVAKVQRTATDLRNPLLDLLDEYTQIVATASGEVDLTEKTHALLDRTGFSRHALLEALCEVTK